jgi:hypothetical protein
MGKDVARRAKAEGYIDNGRIVRSVRNDDQCATHDPPGLVLQEIREVVKIVGDQRIILRGSQTSSCGLTG